MIVETIVTIVNLFSLEALQPTIQKRFNFIQGIFPSLGMQN